MVRLGVRFYPNGSTFKQALHALDGRTRVLGGQIAGDFTLPADPARKLLFIAGGIGITPYRSMLKHLLDTEQRRDVVLLYATRAADEIAYQDVLNDAQARLGARTVYTLTDASAAPRGWSGSTGRIDEALIRAAAPDFAERLCDISGPPDMARASKQALLRLGAPRSHIKTDFFPGLV